MVSRGSRPCVVAICVALCSSACGGGGGSASDQTARLSISPTAVSVSATPGDATPSRAVTLTVTNPPATGVYLQAAYTNTGIESLDFVAASSTQGTLQISFRAPGSLLNNTYSDTITARVCTDEQCTSQIRGSPATITTSYVISGSGSVTATLNRDAIQVSADSREQSSRTETARLTLSSAPASGIYVQTSQSSKAIRSVSSRTVSPTATDLDITFVPASQLVAGTFNDTVTVTVCYDASCVRQVGGGPFAIATTFSVGAAAEPGVTPLQVQSRAPLGHNIVDAEFSKSLNQIVMVGTYPANALYVYDVATATERRQLLSKTPTSVSIAPDGLTAAVGHDALITVVDLPTVGRAGAPAPILLNVSADVFDVVLDGTGNVHAFPRVDQWVEAHSINIATNTERLGSGSLRAGSHARLHPSGSFIYTADNGLSPSDIAKWDITSGVANRLYDSPYHGDYGMCGDLWFDESGSTIYTACGNSFRSSTSQAQDMIYSGRLELFTSNFDRYMIRSLSHAAVRNEIALVEYDPRNCVYTPWAGPCYTHLAFYESQFLNRLAVYSIGPVTVNNTAYAQFGMFVFQDSIGSQKYLLSKLVGMPNPDTEYYMSVVP